MCEMQVNAFQPTDTILQGMAHNTSTIDRDMDMVTKVLKARGEHQKLSVAIHFQDLIHRAYATMLELYGESVSELSLVGSDGQVIKGMREPSDDYEKAGNEKASHVHTNADGSHTHDDGVVHDKHTSILAEIAYSTAQAHPFETR